MTTQREFLGHILDYACHHRHDSVIQTILEKDVDITSLGVPHARIAAASLHKIVHRDLVQRFPTAVVLAEQLFRQLGDQTDSPFVRSFIKLLCGLKVKAFFHVMETSPQLALDALAEYFPQGSSHLDGIVMDPDLAQGLREATSAFRKSIFPILLHPSKRDEFMANQYVNLYGQDFSETLKKRMKTFLDTLGQQWPDTFLDKIMQQQQQANVSKDTSSSPNLSPDKLKDILLDFVEGKSNLQSQDLLDLTDLLDPERPLNVQGFTPSFFNFQQVEGQGSSQVTQRQKSSDGEGAAADQEHTLSAAATAPTLHRPWKEQEENIPDTYSDGSISDVDNMSRDK